MTGRLRKLFLVSIPLFIAHGLEEIFTGFSNIDQQVGFVFSKLVELPDIQALFVLMQIMLWLTFVIVYLSFRGPKWQLRLMFLLGLVLIYELHHLYNAIRVGGYYPGLITALFLYVLGFFFWKELLRIRKVKGT